MRTRITYFIALSLVAALALTGAGCQTAGPAAATVNGVDIPESAVEEEFARAEIASPGYYEGEDGPARKAEDRTRVIEYLINVELQRQAVKEADIKVTDEEVATQLEQERSMYQTDEEWQQVLAQSGFSSDEQIEKYLHDTIGFQRLAEQIAADALNTEPSDEEIQKYYDENSALFTTGPERHGRHILVADEATAKSVIERLEDGEDFADLAAELSTDPGSKDSGGDLGWSDGNGFVDGFRETYQTLPVGGISDPIQTEFGFHVIEMLEEREGGLTPLADVRDMVAQDLKNTKANEMVTDFMAKQKEDATIVVYDTDGNEIAYPFAETTPTPAGDPAGIEPTELEPQPAE